MFPFHLLARMYLWGGTNIGEGSRGPRRPLVGPGQSPGGGFRGRSPPKQNDF